MLLDNNSLNQNALAEKGKEFFEWLNKLRQFTADKLNIKPSEVKINEEEAFKYYNDVFSPTQCLNKLCKMDKEENILTQVFDFEKGDIIEFCDENYFVIENSGSQGVVNPLGENYYVRFFEWQYQGEKAKFIRKPTKDELEWLGLLN